MRLLHRRFSANSLRPMRTRRINVLDVVLVAALLAGFSPAPTQELLKLEGDVGGVHDPVIIKERGTYYVFATGGRAGQGIIPIRTSSDLRTWKTAGYVLEALPAWATQEIPQARNAWAPDISFYNGKYHYFTALTTDHSGIDDVRDLIRNCAFEPNVFKKRDRKAKQVDIALATKALIEAARDNYDVAVLIAGDEDYVPMAEGIKELGKSVYLAFLKSLAAAD
jgi:uncharacterized LabA/DUF88 family protein